MLIKEYRILMPLSVDEYRIAQLYMIQKKSQAESTGQGSGVEIIKNEPYFDGPGGKGGQYTFKYFHVGSHLPNWFRNILPKNALLVEEEAWNAYPFTKTRYKVPLIEKFTLDVETHYYNDCGDNDNVFELTEEEKKTRIIEYMDIVSDPISSGDYKVEEDPKIYESVKTGRGPLNDNWREEHKNSTDPNKKIMCAYKLCRIEFKYWGMQTKIERFIDEVGLRKTMLRAHRQAWCWQDEWWGLTIEDIRNLEIEAQENLAKKMRENNGTVDNNLNDSEIKTESSPVVRNSNKNTSGNIEAIQRQDSISDDEDDAADLFEDAKSEMPSETDSFMTCKNTFASNLTLHIDPVTGNPNISSPKSPQKKSVLILVLHGGSLLDTSHEYHNKHSDISTLRQTFDYVTRTLYPQLKDRIAIKLVACPSIVHNILNSISKLTPQTCDQNYRSNLTNQQYIPLAAIPLFLTQTSEYQQAIKTIRDLMNDRYNEFLRQEGFIFDGPVNVIADSIGSLFIYDILSSHHTRFNNGGYTVFSDSDTVNSTSQQSLLDDHVTPKTQRKSSTHSTDSNSDYFPTLLSPLEFPVHQVFLLGSPLGLVLEFRINQNNESTDISIPKQPTTDTLTELGSKKTQSSLIKQKILYKPMCRQLFNIFHQTDPSAYRLEPLINSRLFTISPYKVLNYHNYHQNSSHSKEPNCSIDESNYFIESLFNNPIIIDENNENLIEEAKKESAEMIGESELSRFLKMTPVKKAINEWWGEKRIDYCLHTPHGVQNLPLGALPHLLHASYWESRDCVAFVLTQMMQQDLLMGAAEDHLNDLIVDQDTMSSMASSEHTFGLDKMSKLKSKSSSLRFKTMCVPYKVNVSINHRANDVIVLTGQSQILSARFMYGALDIVTPKNQKVDVFIMTQPINHGHWEKEGTEIIDTNGRIQFRIPESRRLSEGIYPIRMVLQSDWSAVDFHLAVLPRNVEIVVFSIDGSFAASVSLSGKDPKIRAGCIDVARFWQDRGYLLIYISARPSLQQRSVQKWLAEHKFPFGLLLFSDGVSREPIKRKMNVLSKLIKEVNVKIHCAYGSAKDISVYQALGLHSHQIFTIGRLTKNQKENTFSIKRGYANHLNDLLRPDNPISKASRRTLENLSYLKTSFEQPIRHIDIHSAFYQQFHEHQTINQATAH